MYPHLSSFKSAFEIYVFVDPCGTLDIRKLLGEVLRPRMRVKISTMPSTSTWSRTCHHHPTDRSQILNFPPKEMRDLEKVETD